MMKCLTCRISLGAMGSFVAVCGTPSTKTGVALGCLAGLALELVSVCMNTGVAASGACSSEFTVSQSIQGLNEFACQHEKTCGKHSVITVDNGNDD